MSRNVTAPRKTILYVTLAVIVVGILIAVGYASRPDVVSQNATAAVGQSTLKIGGTAPEFSIATNAGTFDLKAVSTPVLLEVFAPWCPHCQRETATLNDLAAKYAGKLAIVSISGDAIDYEHNNAPESADNVTRFASQYQTRYPVAFDRDLKVAQMYLKSGFPSIYVIDADKKIRFHQEGEVPEGDLVKAIDASIGAARGT